MVTAENSVKLQIKSRHVFTCAVLINTLAAWALLGILDVDRMEGEGFYTFFQKHTLTLQVKFRNPYLSDPFGEESAYEKRMGPAGVWLQGTPEFNDYSDYCRTRYRIMSIKNPEGREKCREQDHIHWKTDKRYQSPVFIYN